jgi:hypothetical protein
MSEPHKVSEPKDYSKIPTKDLTGKDAIDIINTMALEHRFKFRNYELFALGWAIGAIKTLEELEKP